MLITCHSLENDKKNHTHKHSFKTKKNIQPRKKKRKTSINKKIRKLLI